MTRTQFPTIDLRATGENIIRLRKSNGLTVRELQEYFGFEEPQAIYKWQQGKSLPTVDNLFALSHLFGVSMNDILVQSSTLGYTKNGQSKDCPSVIFSVRALREQQRYTASDQFLRNFVSSADVFFRRNKSKNPVITMETYYRLSVYRAGVLRLLRINALTIIEAMPGIFLQSKSLWLSISIKKYAALQFICT